METLTQDKGTSALPIQTPKQPKQPKQPKARKAKGTKPAEAVVPWQALPKGLIAGKHYYRRGDTYVVQKGKFAGDTRKRQQDLITLPTVAQLMEADSKLTQKEAESMVADIGTRIKPGVMAEISRAGSNAAYIVKRYVSKLTDKSHDIGVSLHRVQVQDEIDKLASKYNLTRDEVCKRLKLPVPQVVA